MFEIKERLTTENILSKISDEQIFKYYCKNFKQVGVKFNSELRDDPVASCIISYYNNRLWYKDFGVIGQKAVNCFDYIMLKYGMTFQQALGIINLDFNLNLAPFIEHPPSLTYVGSPDTNLLTKTSVTGFSSTIIIPTFRNWLEIDVKYWKNNYYLSIPKLEFFDIYPIKSLEINGKQIPVEMHTYSYMVDIEDGITFYKIYSPFNKNYKWISNCKAHHYLGMNQLPWLGDKLIITKSLKDIAVLSLFNLPAIAPQSESQILSHEKYVMLSKRFKTFYVLYDNDRAGVEGAMQTVETFKDIKPIFIPVESGVKDISDFIDKYRYRATEKLVKSLII